MRRAAFFSMLTRERRTPLRVSGTLAHPRIDEPLKRPGAVHRSKPALVLAALAVPLLIIGPSTNAAFTAMTSSSGSLIAASLDAWQPTGVNASRSGTTCLVTWTPNPTAPSGVTYDVSGGTTTVTTPANATSASIAVGTAMVTPQVVVRKGPWVAATPVTSATACAGLPDAPVVTATGGEAGIAVSWTAPAGNGATITGYTATTSPASTTCTRNATDPTTCTFTGLTNGVTYTVSVTATSSAGTGPAGTATAMPYPQSVISSSDTAIWLDAQYSPSMTTSSDCTGSASALNSLVGCWLDRSANGRNASAGASTPMLTSSAINGHPAIRFAMADLDRFEITTPGVGAVNNGNRTFFVVAKSQGGYDGSSNTASVIIQWPSPHDGIEFNGYPSTTSASLLTHTNSGGLGSSQSAGTSPILFSATASASGSVYAVDASVNGQNPSVSTRAASGWNAYPDQVRIGSIYDSLTTFTDPLNGDIGEIIVLSRAVTGTERRTVEAYLARKWGVQLAPAAPTGVSVTPGDAQLTVSWTAPSDPGTSSITSYTATAQPGGATCTSAGTSCTITGLTNGTLYDVTVNALSSVGTGAGSAPASGTPRTGSKLYFAGSTSNGEGGFGLGPNNLPGSVSPASVTTWASVSTAKSSSCGIRQDGTLWCWGQNTNGQLGLGDTTNRTTPVQVGSATTWSQVDVGTSHTCAVRTDSSLWCWGNNSSGQLGHGDTTNRTSPAQVTAGASGWVAVTTGNNHTCAIAASPSYAMWCWGNNSTGQLGSATPSQALSPLQLTGNWHTVSAGSSFTCATSIYNEAYCWGTNAVGQLGLGDTTNRTSPTKIGTGTNWFQISAGVDANSVCGVQLDESLWCWGVNSNGQLGLGDTTNRTSPTQVSGQWTTIAAGSTSTCGRAHDGSAWCWGLGSSGQLGIGDGSTQLSPVMVNGAPGIAYYRLNGDSVGAVSVGADFACVATTGGAMQCWGGNGSGQLGRQTIFTFLTQVGTVTTWASVSIRDRHACATRIDGTLWCWGLGSSGQLGQGDTVSRVVPTQVLGATSWATVSAGSSSTCAIATDANLWCWGNNANGQLGTGDTASRVTPAEIGAGTHWSNVAVGSTHTCAVATDGSLWCWGDNSSGQLGQGDTTARLLPIRVGALDTWASVTVGTAFSCAVRVDATGWCWGSNSNGQLGQGDTTTRTSPTQISNTWKILSAGDTHVCAIRANLALWCWGSNAKGQLGTNDNTQRLSPTSIDTRTIWDSPMTGPAETCARHTDSTAGCTGDNSSGQMGIGSQTDQNGYIQEPTARTTWRSGDVGLQSWLMLG